MPIVQAEAEYGDANRRVCCADVVCAYTRIACAEPSRQVVPDHHAPRPTPPRPPFGQLPATELARIHRILGRLPRMPLSP